MKERRQEAKEWKGTERVGRSGHPELMCVCACVCVCVCVFGVFGVFGVGEVSEEERRRERGRE